MTTCRPCSQLTEGDRKAAPATVLAPGRPQDGDDVLWMPICDACKTGWFDPSDPASSERGFHFVDLGQVAMVTCPTCGQITPVDLVGWEASGEAVCSKCHQLLSVAPHEDPIFPID
jgi:uncharacterized Zn-finger protein